VLISELLNDYRGSLREKEGKIGELLQRQRSSVSRGVDS